MRLELFEIVDEHGDNALGLPVVGLLVRPGLAWIEDGCVHARNGDRYRKAKIRIGAEFGLVQAAIQGRRRAGPASP